MIEDNDELTTQKFEREYRACRRQEPVALFTAVGCQMHWLLHREIGFYKSILLV